MMEKYQKPPYNGTLREAGIQEDQEIAGEDGYQRSGEKLE
jgi:hypothetical protein